MACHLGSIWSNGYGLRRSLLIEYLLGKQESRKENGFALGYPQSEQNARISRITRTSIRRDRSQLVPGNRDPGRNWPDIRRKRHSESNRRVEKIAEPRRRGRLRLGSRRAQRRARNFFSSLCRRKRKQQREHQQIAS